MTVDQLRTALVEASLAWQAGVDDNRRGLMTDGELNSLAVTMYKATRAYRAATR